MLFLCLCTCISGLLFAELLPVSGAPTLTNLPSQAFTLKCLDGRIEVDVQTNDDFKGVIYTEGSFRRDGCHLDAAGGTNFQLKFALNDCKTVDNGNGVYTNVIIVQNEDELVTRDDSSFEVKCDYNLKATVRLEAQRPIQVEGSETTTGRPGSIIGQQRAVASVARNSIFVSGQPIRNGSHSSNGSNVAAVVG